MKNFKVKGLLRRMSGHEMEVMNLKVAHLFWSRAIKLENNT